MFHYLYPELHRVVNPFAHEINGNWSSHTGCDNGSSIRVKVNNGNFLLSLIHPSGNITNTEGYIYNREVSNNVYLVKFKENKGEAFIFQTENDKFSLISYSTEYNTFSSGYPFTRITNLELTKQ